MSREQEHSRLKELIYEAADLAENWETVNFTDTLADYLLDNGVIVPPVKAGDKVYELVFHDGKPDSYYEQIVVGYHHTQDNKCICVVGRYYHCQYTRHLNISRIGKTVFLTQEEAEKALKELT